MKVSTMWRWLVLLLLTSFSIYVVTPPKQKIRLGLDLQGGTSFTVQIDQERLVADYKASNPEATDEAVQQYVKNVMTDADTRTLEVLRNRIDALGTQEPALALGQNHQIQVQIPGADAEQSKAAEESIKSAAFLTFRLVHRDNDALASSLLNGTAPVEGYVRATTRAGQSCLVRTAEFTELQKDPAYPSRLGRTGTPSNSYEMLLEKLPDFTLDGQVAYRPYFIHRAVLVQGDDLSGAEVDRDPMTGRTAVAIAFKAPEKFAKVTRDYAPNGERNKNAVGRQLAIVLDDIVYSAPVIQTEITDGRAVITGNFTYAEAAVLRNVLNAGSLPAPIKILAKSSVSPTLGQEAIEKGVYAGVLGVAMVMIFMLVYYVYCGLIADTALVLNAILWPAGMIIASTLLSVFAKDVGGSINVMQLPVLTLPGIAGLVLSVGMAVDANVLIFERIREEFRTGKSARAAVAAGYNRAYLAIIDSNLTTLLTGVILFIFGSGPIRGFAVTLCGGIIISMFTALVVTRLIFDLFTPETRVKPYKMLQLIPENVNFDFFKYAKPAMLVSFAVIIITVGAFAFRVVKEPSKVLAVDFAGGIAMTFDGANGDIPDDDFDSIQKVITESGATDAVLQKQTADGESNVLIKSSTTVLVDADGKEIPIETVVEKLLQEKYPDLGISMESAETIGSQVGGQLKRDALLSVIFALVGIIIYVKIRFEFGFALGGVAALAHDALITLGIYTILGRQFSLTTLAALLTIVGYSINDTIVIFDRIREDLRKDTHTPFQTLVNRAMNQTLSRTILTTLSTLITVTALYFFGGPALNDFALALLIGMIAGTYSTLFIATPLMVMWYKGSRPKAVVDSSSEKTAIM